MTSMNPERLCYWLKGAVDTQPNKITAAQAKAIKIHLADALRAGRNDIGTYVTFCRWLDGVLEFHDENTDIPENKLVAVHTRLTEALGSAPVGTPPAPEVYATTRC